MSESHKYEGEEQSRWRRALPFFAGFTLIGVAVVIIGFFLDTAPRELPKQPQEVIVNILVPPPPPPPKETPPPEEKMIEQVKPTEKEIKDEKPVEEPKPEEPAPDKAKDEPPAGPLGLDQKADGPGDNFNLVGRPGGRGLLGGGGGGGSRWGYYAAKVQRAIQERLKQNRKTGFASVNYAIGVRLWLDEGGRISRISLDGSSGNPEIDGVIQAELTGYFVSDAPPKDMPMPVVTRIKSSPG